MQAFTMENATCLRGDLLLIFICVCFILKMLGIKKGLPNIGRPFRIL